MSKKSMISAALAAVLLIAAIVLSIVLFGGISALPDGAKQFKNVVNGCSKMSASAVQSNYGRSSVYSAPSLVGCETIDDYMKSCGIEFSYMQEEGNTTQRVYFVSSAEGAEYEDNWLLQDEISLFQVVVGADYLNSDGETKTAYGNFMVVCGKNGGILAIL